MKICDVNPSTEERYFGCLYTSPEQWKDWVVGIEGKREWYGAMKEKGIRAKLALDDQGEPRGMIQYGPSELNFINCKNMYFVHCIYIPKIKGEAKFRKTGMGAALLEAAEQDARAKGADAMMAWGVSMPFWMKASYYKKRGYSRADKNGMAVLMWKPFTDKARKPSWDRPLKFPELKPGKVRVSSFNCGWCTLQNAHAKLTEETAREFGDAVEYQHVDTSLRENLEEWGISDAIYLDGREMIKGPPMDRRQIRKKIAAKVKKLRPLD
jgi:GNAT superfamily N-acetyltransferase